MKAGAFHKDQLEKIENLQRSEQKQKLSKFWVENIVWQILSGKENCQSSEQKRLFAKFWAKKEKKNTTLKLVSILG